MIGPAELREMEEVLAEERQDTGSPDRRTPYLTPHFAMGVAMTRAVAGGLKQHLLPGHQNRNKR